MSLFNQAINSKYLMQTPIEILTRPYTKASVSIPLKIELKQSIFNTQKFLTTLTNNKFSKIITNCDTITVSNMNSPISDTHGDTFSLNGAKSSFISASTSTCSSPNIPTTRSFEELFNFDGSQRGLLDMILRSLKTKLHKINSFAFDIYQNIFSFLGAKSNFEVVEPDPIFTPVLTPVLDPITETKHEDHNIDYIWLRLNQILLSDDPIEIQKTKLFELSKIQLGNYNNQTEVANKYNFEELELPFLVYFLFLIYCLYLKATILELVPHKKLPKAPRETKINKRSSLKSQCKQNYKIMRRYSINQPS